MRIKGFIKQELCEEPQRTAESVRSQDGCCGYDNSTHVSLCFCKDGTVEFDNYNKADNNTSYANCPSSICNDRVNISYPFWRLDSHNPTSPQYCGYPGFGINCSQNDAILYISNDSFLVREINYSTHSLSLVDIDVLDSKECPRAYHNLTLDDDSPLKYSELDMNINFYYNCTGSLLDSAPPLDCLTSGGKRSYFYAEDYELEDLINWYGICEKKVVVPVTKSVWNGRLSAAMVEGFVLNWENTTDCGKCEASDGCCGYNNSTHESLCFCKDGTVKFDDCNKGTPSLRA
ncbi:hypothetical protein RND71_021639 [Anisodus tanguticus]|uniref:non-specific serine/threonine protein kinase n=1 Tax=Anisodus tanguticus TaxID=243964 RepID=A0AAE1VGB1_9SOLA|nr:hypothetical protein RND71_021639 [Anisodus tanguticus]